jgi:membrane-bound ClpP family serine protease
MRMLRKGPLAKFFYLGQNTPPTPSQSSGGIPVGTKGRCVTRMNPSGLVQLGGKRLEAISRDGLIEEGAEVELIGEDAFRIEVRRVR